uniref:Tetratricopeptide SHNi-TPR domain-containing protein n=1 Tax=Plectus sambesii TaxID=2011161 RepID=A0A914X6A7_9BILA
ENNSNALSDEELPEEGISAEEGAVGDEPPALETDSTDDTANNVPNLQLAWEVLDVARAVCDKQEKTDEWQQKKSEVLLLLGDVSIEDENYKQAIDDLAVCLDIQQKIYAGTDRRIAETLFQMARAFNLSFEFAKAAEYYKKAYDVIKLCADAHETKMTAGVECPDEKATIEKELSELQALLPDIQLKVDDSLESAKNAELLKEQQADGTAAPAFEDKETAASKPAAADISNLVRKPVKRSIEPDEAEAAVKRCKGDDEGEADVTTTNGNGHSVEANGDNGHAATAEA